MINCAKQCVKKGRTIELSIHKRIFEDLTYGIDDASKPLADATTDLKFLIVLVVESID